MMLGSSINPKREKACKTRRVPLVGLPSACRQTGRQTGCTCCWAQNDTARPLPLTGYHGAFALHGTSTSARRIHAAQVRTSQTRTSCATQHTPRSLRGVRCQLERCNTTLNLNQRYFPRRPTVCVSRKWAGVDKAGEQYKLKARQKSVKRAESHLSACLPRQAARFVGHGLADSPTVEVNRHAHNKPYCVTQAR